MTTDLSSLIERIEKSEGPDRAADALIGAAIRWLPQDGQAWLRDWRGDFGPMPRMTGRIAAFHDNGDPAVHWEAPNFTASLDAAVTLVPEGWYWRAGHGVLWPGWAHLNLKHPDHCDRGDEHSAHAETPALALCAAALRARIKEME